MTGLRTDAGRVTGVVTDRGDVECETVVICRGHVGPRAGAPAGVDIPLQAAEHYYLLTEPIEGVHRDLPVIEDPDRYGYYREEGGGLLVGLFEPVAAPWHLDGTPGDSRSPSSRRTGTGWRRTSRPRCERFPALADAGIRTFFCGPE